MLLDNLFPLLGGPGTALTLLGIVALAACPPAAAVLATRGGRPTHHHWSR